MTYAIIRERAPRETSHRCGLPGFWGRHVNGLRLGAIVACTQCLKRYEWKSVAIGWDAPDERQWVAVHEKRNT